MKKILPFIFAVVLITACQKDPDTGKLDNNYLVYTSYDTAAVFSDYTNLFVVDSILVIGDKTQNAEYWNNTNSATIIAAFVNNLTGSDVGYTRVDEKSEADLGLQLSYVNNTYYFSYSGNSPWWSGYPYYWNGYWGSGWGWNYPYPITYSYSTGSIIADLIDLENVATSTSGSKTVTVVWTAYICGLLNGSSLNMQRTLNGVNQAFDQSPYLKK